MNISRNQSILPRHRLQHILQSTLLGCLLLTGLAPLAYAQQADEEENPETPVQLPGAPQADNLLLFYNNSAQTFMIDTKSMSITKEGIIRFSLVATSNSGAKNISYEGIRCETGEKKLYALGRADGTWTKVREPSWSRIFGNSFNNHHNVLARDYFCDGSTIAGKPEQMINRIRRQESLRP
ncbi:MAG: CNP1-like family protein [Burkholderiaceae bacterium]|nr:CNP1-like family protein [Burkholderiaceae bacterium]